MLISQGVFTNLQVVGKQRAERARNLSAKWPQMRRRRKRKRKTLSSHLLKQSVGNAIPALHISSERLYGRSRFQLKSHLLRS